ncbi:MAG TPA: LPS export ABC transporter periplasmic protein LptC [Syntrophorhabdales bacterium]|nr:LPS export ABC transporter periplasmic protein LptC [Syntrophorhabdales bacterium]
MNRRSLAGYIAFAFAISILLYSGYFFVKRPDRHTAHVVEEEKRVIVFRDVKYSGEKKGAIDWELRAKIARKFIDKPVVELEQIEGSYRPRPDTVVLFKGDKGELDTEAEKGRVDNVEIIYKDEYTVKSKSMDFDFKSSKVSSQNQVDLKGKMLTLQGLGMVADTEKQVVHIEKDVHGTVETQSRRFNFSSDRFSYDVKQNIYTFSGSVAVKGEDMTLFCDTIDITSTGDTVDKLDARGKVILNSKGTLAKSGRAVYYLKDDRVTLEDSPRITKDKVDMQGQLIVYSLSTGKFTVEGPKMRIER